MKFRTFIVLITLVVIAACNKDEPLMENPPLLTNEIEGSVTLPEGSTIDVNTLVVSSPAGSASVSNGNYRMNNLQDRFLTQLVSDANGEIILMGYTYPEITNKNGYSKSVAFSNDFEINATSTALAMLMNMPPSLLMAAEGKQELINKILNHPDLPALVGQIEGVIVKNQSPLSIEQTELAQMVADLYDTIFDMRSKANTKSDDESYPMDIRLINNEITFVNPGKSYETVVGIYKDDQRLKKIEVDRVTFFPTTIGEAIGAAVAATNGEIPSGLEPVEYDYTLENDGEYKIKVRTGDSDENDAETKEALLNNYENWVVDLLVEVVPLGDCFQPTIGNLKQFIQSFTTLPIANTPQEKLGLVYDILYTFFNETITVVTCFVSVDEYKEYFEKLGKVLKWLDLVGKIGNASNIWVGIMQIDHDEGAMDKCYNVDEGVVTECNTAGVYVAGFEVLGNDHWVAKVWKNGVATSLTDGSSRAWARSVFVSDTDVYVVGGEINGNGIVEARVWKNGVKTSLIEGNYTTAHSVYVSDNDIYVVGTELTIATVWKNGVPTKLANGQSHANSIYVSDNDVYVAGSVRNGNGQSVATVWKNGVATSLTDGVSQGFATSVYVSDNDVYVAGHGGGSNGSYVAKVWKNGVTTRLSEDSYEVNGYANSVYVSGSDVYVAGYENVVNGPFTAKVWKNGVASSLTGISNYPIAYSVFVPGNDVYVAGNGQIENNKAVAIVWKNGVATALTDVNKNNHATSIFVK